MFAVDGCLHTVVSAVCSIMIPAESQQCLTRLRTDQDRVAGSAPAISQGRKPRPKPRPPTLCTDAAGMISRRIEKGYYMK